MIVLFEEISDKFASGKLITIKAADIDICCEEREIIRQIRDILTFN